MKFSICVCVIVGGVDDVILFFCTIVLLHRFLLLPSLSVFCVSLFTFPDEDILLLKLLIVSCLFVRRRPLVSMFS